MNGTSLLRRRLRPRRGRRRGTARAAVRGLAPAWGDRPARRRPPAEGTTNARCVVGCARVATSVAAGSARRARGRRGHAQAPSSAATTTRTTAPMASERQPTIRRVADVRDARGRRLRGRRLAGGSPWRRFAIYEQASRARKPHAVPRRPTPPTDSPRAAALPRLAPARRRARRGEPDEPGRRRAGRRARRIRPLHGPPCSPARCWRSPSLPALAAWLVERSAAAAHGDVHDDALVLRRADLRDRGPARRDRRRRAVDRAAARPRALGRAALRPAPAAWPRDRRSRGAADARSATPARRGGHPDRRLGARATRRCSPPWRWHHLLWKFVGFALAPAAVLFNAHQHIAYGGTLGQYYLEGARRRTCARSPSTG